VSEAREPRFRGVRGVDEKEGSKDEKEEDIDMEGEK
jgi:hypothetical protein